VVEAALKQSPGENRAARCARIVISWLEGTSQHWTDSKMENKFTNRWPAFEEFGKLFVAGDMLNPVQRQIAICS